MLDDRQLIRANLRSEPFLRLLLGRSSKARDEHWLEVGYKTLLMILIVMCYWLINNSVEEELKLDNLALVMVADNLNITLRIVCFLESIILCGRETPTLVQNIISIWHTLVMQLSGLLIIAYFVMKSYLWEIGTPGHFSTFQEMMLYLIIPSLSIVPLFVEIIIFKHWYYLVSTVPFCLLYLILLIQEDEKALTQSEEGKLTFASSWAALWIFASLIFLLAAQYAAWWTNRYLLFRFYKVRWWKTSTARPNSTASEQELATISNITQATTRYAGYLPRVYFS